MTSDEFRNWRQQLGLSQSAAARALGLSRSSIIDYENGIKRCTDRAAPVPRVVELACQALQMLREPMQAREPILPRESSARAAE